jgi:uncharacterized protein (DUF305 family)
MQFASISAHRLKLVIGTVLALSGLTACNSAPITTTPVATPTASAMSGMDHSQMDHGSMNHNMDLGPADADFDLRFVDSMIPHHQGAIVMAQTAQQKAKHPEIKQLATSIIKAQNTEIAQMQQWRQAWYPKANATPMAYDAKTGTMMPMSAKQKQDMMMDMDLGAADDQFDLRFINAMIPHHEGAVTMAQAALPKSKRPEIQKLATAIVASQQAEIAQMKQWRQTWYQQ